MTRIETIHAKNLELIEAHHIHAGTKLFNPVLRVTEVVWYTHKSYGWVMTTMKDSSKVPQQVDLLLEDWVVIND